MVTPKYFIKLFLFLSVFFTVQIGNSQTTENDTVYVQPDTVYNEDAVVDEEYNDNVEVETVKASISNVDVDKENNVQSSVSLQDTISKLKKEEDYWYHNYIIPNKKVVEEKARIKPSNIKINFSGWVIIGILFLVILFLFLQANGINIFGKSSKKISEAVVEDELPENIFEIDFDKAIQTFVQQNNYRQATRMLFLKLLKTMSVKNVINYSPEKTNFDYLFSLMNTKAYNDFAEAVKIYEYVWYGEFNINNEQFGLVKKQFDKLQDLLDK